MKSRIASLIPIRSPDGAGWLIPLTKGAYALVCDYGRGLVVGKNWHLGPSGRAARNHRDDDGRKRTLFMHSVILPVPSGFFVDHVNGDPLDNRRTNLRVCTASQNAMNRGPYAGTSKFVGVSWVQSHRKWKASIKREGKQTHIGFFSSEIDAARAYDSAARVVHGEFARVNFRESGAAA